MMVMVVAMVDGFDSDGNDYLYTYTSVYV